MEFMRFSGLKTKKKNSFKKQESAYICEKNYIVDFSC